ncbi:unnamed protein product [Penicillium camemberti]|uniref:Str. FM013 n=1 Tax=Penicillium camemberti (strain FM 013) TaxID=1429867 RepID=A0A0G4PMA1_PENC3|nr:unnamed protein product [Penicillium camemberti]
MQIPTTLHALLATALLLASFFLFVWSRRAVQKTSLHQKLDLAVFAPKIVLLAVHMGLSWSRKCETGREVILGVTSLFPSLLVYLRISIFLRSLPSAPYQLMICFPLFALFSCLTKITATVVGTYFDRPLRVVVLFLLFLDHLGLGSLLWWLDGYTMAHTRTRVQMRCALYCTVGVAAVLLLIAVLGVVLSCWLLSLELQLLILMVWMIILFYAVRSAGSPVGEHLACSTHVVGNEF